MAEKKTATKKVATKKLETVEAPVVEKKAAPKKCAAKKQASAPKTTVDLTAENVGFRAGDVYQTLAAAGKALSVADIAATANITTEETYLGIGWLMKEGKVKNSDHLVALAQDSQEQHA